MAPFTFPKKTLALSFTSSPNTELWDCLCTGALRSLALNSGHSGVHVKSRRHTGTRLLASLHQTAGWVWVLYSATLSPGFPLQQGEDEPYTQVIYLTELLWGSDDENDCASYKSGRRTRKCRGLMFTECLLIAKSILTILRDRQYRFHFSDEETNSKKLKWNFPRVNDSYDLDSSLFDFKAAIRAAQRACLPGPPPWDGKLSRGRVSLYTLPQGTALSGCSQWVFSAGAQWTVCLWQAAGQQDRGW